MSPKVIDSWVNRYPAGFESFVIGIPGELGCERAELFVERKSERLFQHQKTGYCSQELTAYKVLKGIFIVKDLPRSPISAFFRLGLR